MRKEDCYYEDNFYDTDKETRDGKKSIILVLSIFIIFGLFFGFVGIFISNSDEGTKETCTDEVIATVIDLKVSRNDDRTITYTPIFEYEYDGYTYRESTKTYSSTFDKTFEKGTTWTIFVNPEKPSLIYCDEIGETSKVISIIFECFGFGMALIFLILSIRVMFAESLNSF